MKAYKEKKLFQNTIDLSFIAKGFYNWKDATMKFRAHEASKCHKEAVLTIITLPKTTADIGETLSNAVRQEKYERRQVLL